MCQVKHSIFAHLVGLVAAVGLASADDTFLYQESFGAPFPSYADDYTQALVKSANQHPNATRSIQFTPFSTTTSDDDDAWTWRVNVTDFAAPNAQGIVHDWDNYRYIPATFVDPHVVNTAYELIWSGGMSVSAALNGSKDPFCVSNALIIGMPANVTNRYSEADTKSTDCTRALGAECVGAILDIKANALNDDDCFSGGDGDDWFGVPECASTLGYAYSQTPEHSTGTSSVNLNSANSSLLKSTGLWGAMSDAFNGSDHTTYERAVNQIQIMMITRHQKSDTPLSQLLCMRVNTTQLHPTDGNSDDDNDGAKGAAGPVQLCSSLVKATTIAWLSLAIGYYL
ncbi:hypothetical protein F5Y18DRAFT_335578 [Xylariaceae sp. FL1019]|nr:hypothetical protein F5Y18DRAFT_335578 [Xylariaceae sp. FL1019]